MKNNNDNNKPIVRKIQTWKLRYGWNTQLIISKLKLEESSDYVKVYYDPLNESIMFEKLEVSV